MPTSTLYYHKLYDIAVTTDPELRTCYISLQHFYTETERHRNFGTDLPVHWNLYDISIDI